MRGQNYEAIVKTPAWTGIRREELCQLPWVNVNLGLKTITARNGKGEKDRVIPIHERLVESLWGYLQSRSCGRRSSPET